MHACVWVCVCTYVWMDVCLYACNCLFTYIYRGVHTRILCVYIYICIQSHTYIHTYLVTYLHTLHYITSQYITLHYITLHYIHTYMGACIHTNIKHIHMYTHTDTCKHGLSYLEEDCCCLWHPSNQGHPMLKYRCYYLGQLGSDYDPLILRLAKE